MSMTFEVLNPRGEIEAKQLFAPTARIADLAGKKIGLYSNGKPGMDNLYTVFEEMLLAKYPDASVTKMTGAFLVRDDDAEALAKEVDAFVYGVGD
ncbi:MAG: hypothetical protein MUO19_03375 [Dehalococcoidales bacterium]|nr:hypothetical protein [Dehalococcoidales bacterium]